MKLNRKIELAEQAIKSISRHDDADLAVRDAALRRLEEFIGAERAAAAERVHAEIQKQVGV
ncbi:MAG TPA: hypothetical protein DCZ11_00285 [Gammaproteobacteria bacterium]|nr:hypothetical protein [Gammaproteobacteria bacterium]MCH76864.1 hypothetical protein [Gammaproteobacteria bacterium]